MKLLGMENKKHGLWNREQAKEVEGIWGKSTAVWRVHAYDLGASLRYVMNTAVYVNLCGSTEEAWPSQIPHGAPSRNQPRSLSRGEL